MKIFKTKITLGLVLLGACAASQYRYYGLDLTHMSPSEAREIELRSPDKKRYRSITAHECWVPRGATPRCVVLKDSEWLSVLQTQEELQKRLEHCEGGR